MREAPRRRRTRLTWRRIGALLACAGVAGGIAGRIAAHREAERKAAHLRKPPDDAAPHARTAAPFDVAESIYDGKLNPAWQDWGWGRHDLSAGPARVVFAGYAGIIFHHREISAAYGALVFRFRAPAAWDPFLSVSLKHAGQGTTSFPVIDVKAEDLADVGDGWQEALISWARLNPQTLPIDAVTISASRQVGPEGIELDKIVLTKLDARAGTTPVRDVGLGISCTEPAKRISPNIYGVSMSAWSTGTVANRIGGNAITRLNWDLGAVWNTGKDWFFENTSGRGSVGEWVDEANAHGARSVVVVPMIGWVAKDASSVGFPVSKFGKQREQDPHRPEAGNGVAPNGNNLRPGPPSETSVPAPPAKIAQWIGGLRARDRDRARSILMYVLDNEPSLWNETHRDVHPEAVTYDELLDRTVRYATAIRNADPETPIAGPAEWGWSAYFFSAKDREVGFPLHPDRRRHGDVPLIAWYLQQLHAHEETHGAKLLDVLDLHFYPQAEGIFAANPRIDPDAAALRLRATRALWDANYVDESWIHEPVELIPRMKRWVAENYPGLKVSLGEWSFGADSHMSGALATAEALGRFGQQGLDSAFYWPGPSAETRAYWAFRAYRNFDGAGAHFLDWSLPTKEADGVSLFASRDDDGTHLVAVLLNSNPDVAARARIDADGCGKLFRRRAFVYSGAPTGFAEAPAAPVGAGIVETVPPYSIEVLELSLAK